MDAFSSRYGGSRTEPAPRVERIRGVRVRTAASFELIDPVTLFYALAIAAGAVAGMVAATLRFD
jgi:hypothetical protein